jgi:hypothetical protein
MGVFFTLMLRADQICTVSERLVRSHWPRSSLDAGFRQCFRPVICFGCAMHMDTCAGLVLNGPTRPESLEATSRVRLRVHENGGAELTILGGPAPGTEVIPWQGSR